MMKIKTKQLSGLASGQLQIILTGIGSQGILFTTRVLAWSALTKGFKVIGSETHGIAQRSDSIISHLKIGNFLSPLVRRGAADIIYAFEQTEFLRTLPYIKSGGVCFVNAFTLPSCGKVKIDKFLKENHILVFPVEATKIASELGNPLLVNLILLGFSLAAFEEILTQSGIISYQFPFTRSEIEQTIKELSPATFLEINLKALEAGYVSFKRNETLTY